MNFNRTQMTNFVFGLIVIFVISSNAMAGGILFVDEDAGPGGDGASWDTAYRFLQDALTDAFFGGVSEIHVAQGTYKPDRDEANPDGTGDRDATFHLLNGVALMGGYAGIGAKDPDERNLSLYETILSGNISNPALIGDNSYNVLSGSNIAQTALLDGLTITAGYAFGAGSSSTGGGIYLESSIVDIINCRIIGNQASGTGGGAFLTDNSGEMIVSITGCVFDGNSGFSGGGGLFADCTFITVDFCQFLSNSSNGASAGGAFIHGSEQTTILNCFFGYNIALEEGGGLITSGIGELTDCVFLDNFSNNHGGALSIGIPANIPINGCSFINNSTSNGHGGGIYCGDFTGEYFLDVSNSMFFSNTSHAWGGAIFAEDWSVTLENCSFENNSSVSSGGGACEIRELNQTVFFTAIACSFVGNSANSSGGAVSNRVNALIENCMFEQNSSAGQGGAVTTSGQDVTVTGCVFTDNFSSETGGGMDIVNSASTKVLACDFVGNESNGGGGLSVRNATAEITASRFIGNTAWGAAQAGNNLGSGGGVSLDRGNTTINNSLFTGNHATAFGGGLMIDGLQSDQFVVTNCTFSNNRADDGAGAVYDDQSTGASLVNCVLWGNTDPSGNLQDAQIQLGPDTDETSVKFSCVQGWDGSIDGFGNISSDPNFIDADGPDNQPGNEDDDLHVQLGSPCIDAGHNWGVPVDENDYDEDGILCELFPVDLDGNPRFNADEADIDPGCGVPVVVDMGAYEYQFDPVDQITYADLTGDGAVSTLDLLSLFAEWGECAKGCCLADLDIDGFVNTVDLLILFANWGACK